MKKTNRFFFFCGLILFVSECWKQWCLTWYLNGGIYQWWYLPFQLCSIPMYLCLVLPVFQSTEIRGTLLAFLSDFCLLSGIFAFFDTSGMHYGFAPLTVHSYSWHIALIFIGLAAGLCRENALQWRSCFHASLLYLACCLIATLLNLAIQPLGNINLFYISPLHEMTQVVFAGIAASLGNTAGILIYMLSTIFGAILFHAAWKLLRKVVR